MNHSFTLDLRHGQLDLFDPALEQPFNSWQLEHVMQGFAWRAESVSFRTLGSGETAIEIGVAERWAVRPDTRRAVLVPFRVGPSGAVRVASPEAHRDIPMPAGRYALLFETHGDPAWAGLTFVPDDATEARVLLADDGISPPDPLLMEAGPA